LLGIRFEKTGLRKPSRSMRKNKNEGKNPHTEGGRHLRYPRTPGGQEEKFSWLSIMDGLSQPLPPGAPEAWTGPHATRPPMERWSRGVPSRLGELLRGAARSGAFNLRRSRPLPSDCRRRGASSPAAICHDPPGCGTRCRGKDRVPQPGGWRKCAQRPSAVPAPAVKASQGLTTEGSDPFRGSRARASGIFFFNGGGRCGGGEGS